VSGSRRREKRGGTATSYRERVTVAFGQPLSKPGTFYVRAHGDRKAPPTTANLEATRGASKADRRAPLFNCFPTKK
jgi:hypothetical protein